MRKPHSSLPLLLALVLAEVLVAPLVVGSVVLRNAAAAPMAEPGAAAAADPIRPSHIGSPADQVADRLGGALKAAAADGGADIVRVSIVTSAEINLDGLAESWRATAVPMGEGRIVAAFVRADRLTKLASLPGVMAVLPPAVNPSPDGNEGPAAPAPARNAAPGARGGPAATQPTHRSVVPNLWYARQALGADRAGANGFDGTGVIVGVEDTGVDFGHPDLHGTFAREMDPASPYYGFPLAYDDDSATTYVLSGGLPAGTNYAGSSASFVPSVGLGVVGSAELQIPAFLGPLTTGGPITPTIVTRTVQYRNTSKSNQIHYGVHPDSVLRRVEVRDQVTYTVPAVFLVSDEATAEHYDSVYVDLGRQGPGGALEAAYDLSSEKPVQLGPDKDPTVAKDLTNDGLADVSGGMIYFIADGLHHVPILDWLWDADGHQDPANHIAPPEAGTLVAFYGDFNGASHGTGTASQIVGQGIAGSRYGQGVNTPPLPGVTDGDQLVGGMNRGLAPGAKIFAARNLGLPNQWLALTRGYDGVANTGDDAQLINNSWGFTTIPPSVEFYDALATMLNAPQRSPRTLIVVSAGNGGQGYSTISSPSSGGTVLAVGAETQYGTDDITSIISDTLQITFGDPSSFTTRGPDLRGRSGTAVLAVGSSSTGAAPLNLSRDTDGLFNGENAWSQFGGTSQAGPQTVAVATLVFQAYKQRTGQWPTWDVARSLMQFGADDADEDPAVQGAGQVNADQGTAIAAGLYGADVSRTEWQVGDHRGTQHIDFPNVARRGASYTRDYTFTNHSSMAATLQLTSDQLTAVGSKEIVLNTTLAAEDSYQFRRPDYMVTPAQLSIPPDTDLMQVQLSHDFANFCTEDPASLHLSCTQRGQNAWYLRAYAWTDYNHNGRVWQDSNSNGVVNNGELDLPATPAFTTSPDPRTSLELNALSEANVSGNSQDLRIRTPVDRAGEGLHLALIHRVRSALVPTDAVRMKVTYYKHQPWPVLSLSKSTLTLAAGASETVRATVAVPADATYGYHQGAIRATTTLPGSQQAGVRILHALPGTASVDVYADGTLIVPNLAYKAISAQPYLDLVPGVHRIQVTARGAPRSASIVDQSVAVRAGTEYTLAAVKTSTGGALQTIVDGNLPPKTGTSKVRLGQLSPDAGPVDVYANGARVLSNVSYRSISSYLLLPDGAYTFGVNVAGTSTVLFTVGPVTLTNANLTLYAVGTTAGGALTATQVSGVARTHFPGHISSMPVALNVAAFGDLSTSVTFGGVPQGNSLFDIGSVQGLTDWRGNGTGRQGDWRNFFLDVPDSATVAGRQFLMNTVWSNLPTDIDLLAYGPQPRRTVEGPSGPVEVVAYGSSLFRVDPAVSGPYDLAIKARSQDTLHAVGPGAAYSFNTVTGGASEWLAGPLEHGLQFFSMHNVLYGGKSPAGVPFTTTLGYVDLNPEAVVLTTTARTGTFPLTLTASQNLPGLEVSAYGLRPTQTYSDSVGQSTPAGNTDDPAGNKIYDFTVGRSGFLGITLAPNSNVPGYDVDIFLQRQGTDGSYATIGSSTGGTADEAISIVLPPAGQYRLIVNGYAVPPGASYTLVIQNDEGDDLKVIDPPSGPIAAGTPVHLTISYDADFVGTRHGIVFMGPTGAPTVFRIPVTITNTSVSIYLPHVLKEWDMRVPTTP